MKTAILIIFLTISLKAQMPTHYIYGDTVKVVAFTPIEFVMCDCENNCDTLTYVGWEEVYKVEYDFEIIYLDLDKRKLTKKIFFTVPIWGEK